MTAINITSLICLDINFLVFDNCSAQGSPAIYFISQSLKAKGICIHKCKALASSGAATCHLDCDMNITSLSIAYCNPDKKSGDDVINFVTGSVIITKTNNSYGKAGSSSGSQIIGILEQKEIFVKDVLYIYGEGSQVIEYGCSVADVKTSVSTFENIVVCQNKCTKCAFLYYIFNQQQISFQNSYFETPEGCSIFIVKGLKNFTYNFDNTYFCGNNFGDGVAGFIPTNSLLTPSIEAGYQTYLCEGALKNKELKTKRSNLQIDKLIPVILFQGSMFQCFNVSLEGVIPE